MVDHPADDLPGLAKPHAGHLVELVIAAPRLETGGNPGALGLRPLHGLALSRRQLRPGKDGAVRQQLRFLIPGSASGLLRRELNRHLSRDRGCEAEVGEHSLERRYAWFPRHVGGSQSPNAQRHKVLLQPGEQCCRQAMAAKIRRDKDRDQLCRVRIIRGPLGERQPRRTRLDVGAARSEEAPAVGSGRADLFEKRAVRREGHQRPLLPQRPRHGFRDEINHSSR